MMDIELIRRLFLYYARFVTKDVRKKIAKQITTSRSHGYDELLAEALALPEDLALPEINDFVFSINEKYVADAIKNNKNTVLFVEYGQVTVMQTPLIKTDIGLAVTIGSEFSIANRDMIEEVLMMQRNLELLTKIIDTMVKDQREQTECGVEYITFPAEILPVEPQLFYDHGGWVAMFKRAE